MKRGIALIICLFAMTIQAHLTHAAEAILHGDELAPIKRKADDSDDLDQKEKRKKEKKAVYYAANKEKKAAKNAAYRAAHMTFLQFRGDEVKPLLLCVHTLPGFDSQA